MKEAAAKTMPATKALPRRCRGKTEFTTTNMSQGTGVSTQAA